MGGAALADVQTRTTALKCNISQKISDAGRTAAAVRPRGRSDVGAEGVMAAREALAGAAGASAGFCPKMMLGHAGGQGTCAPCCLQAVSFSGFVAAGRWQTDEPRGAGG